MTTRRAQERTAMLPGNLHVPEDCRAVSEVLERVGDKWTVLVVVTLDRSASMNCGARSQAFPSACSP